MIEYENPFDELKERENIYVAFDFERNKESLNFADGCITISLLNSDMRPLSNVIVIAENDKMLANPFIIPSNTMVTKQIFRVRVSSTHIYSIESLNGEVKYRITKGLHSMEDRIKFEDEAYSRELKIMVNQRIYTAKIRLHDIVSRVSWFDIEFDY